MLLSAKEEAKKITAEAETKAQQVIEVGKKEIKEKEEKASQRETRLIKKRGDAR